MAASVKKQSTLQLCVRKTRSSSKRMKENAENKYQSSSRNEGISPEKRRRLISPLSPTKTNENVPNDGISPQKRRRTINSLGATKFEESVPAKVESRIPFSPVKLSGENQRNKCSLEPNSAHISRLCFEKDVNVYQEAKVALSLADNLKLYGREIEIEEITKFLNDHLDRVRAGSLYISGAPGTGKTASIELILKVLSWFKK